MCLPGSSECRDNTMHVCGINGTWVSVDCPENTSCQIRNGGLACVPNDSRDEKIDKSGWSRSDDRDEDVDPQLESRRRKKRKTGRSGNSRKATRHNSKRTPEYMDEENGSDADDEEESDRNDGTSKRDEEDSNNEENGELYMKKPRIDSQRGKSRGKPDRTVVKRAPKDVQDSKRGRVKVVTKTVNRPKDKNGNGSGKNQSRGEGGENGGNSKNKAGSDESGSSGKSKGENEKGGGNSNDKKEGGENGMKTVTVTEILRETRRPTEITFEYAGKPQSVSGNVPSALISSGGQNGYTQTLGGMQQPQGVGPLSTVPQVQGGASQASGMQGGGYPQLGAAGMPGQGISSGSAAGSGTSGSSGAGGGGSGGSGGDMSGGSGGGSSGSAGGDSSGGASGGGSGGSGGDTSGGSGGSGDTGGQSGGGSSAGKITKEQLEKAVKSAGYTPNSKYLDVVLKKTNEKFPNKDEAAMFIAQLIHESGGLNHIEELACKNGGCKGKYGTGAPGKSYYGRGFIQLTWPDNYKAASKGIGLGNQLYENPDKVSKDPNIAMDVSVWFWKTRVANQPGVKNMQFGATTKAINGPIECSGGGNQTPQKRYQIYLKVADAFGVKKKASSSGC